jgi:hypothetical protein
MLSLSKHVQAFFNSLFVFSGLGLKFTKSTEAPKNHWQMRRKVRLTRGPQGRFSFSIPCFQQC